MTKRFTSMYNEQSDMIQYVDTLKEEPNKWSICNVSGTLKKLNELHEENQHLESHLNMVREVRDEVIKEIELLRTALKELKEIGDYQSKRINELSDENELLKEELNAFKPIIFEDANNESSSILYEKVEG